MLVNRSAALLLLSVLALGACSTEDKPSESVGSVGTGAGTAKGVADSHWDRRY